MDIKPASHRVALPPKAKSLSLCRPIGKAIRFQTVYGAKSGHTKAKVIAVFFAASWS